MINIEHLCRDLKEVRRTSPLVQNITNYVVMNNTANALLAAGASPVMIHCMEESADMARMASALVLNIGTIDPSWVDSMIAAAKSAFEAGVPVVFDPVGAGATPYRSEVCRRILNECRLSIIRGNASEIIALVNVSSRTKGVDSTDTSESALDSAKKLAAETGAAVVISGATDYITDGDAVESVSNGSPMMARVTGMGCTSTALAGAFAAVNPDMLEAAAHTMAVMGIAGEIAAAVSEGPGSLQMNFLDALYNLDDETIGKTIRL